MKKNILNIKYEIVFTNEIDAKKKNQSLIMLGLKVMLLK